MPPAGARWSRSSPAPTVPSPANPRSEPGSRGGGRRPRVRLRACRLTHPPRIYRRPFPRPSGPRRLAIDGPAALGELGEEIDDEWQYVQDLVDAWRRGSRPWRTPVAMRRLRPSAARRRARRGRGGPDRRSAPGDRLALHPAAGRARRAGRAAVRFQDAAPDARAVVYAASRRIRSSRAQRLPAHAIPGAADPRPRGDERRDDRRRRNGGRCSRRCSAPTRDAAVTRGLGRDPRGGARGRRARRAGRGQFRGAHRRIADRAAPPRRQSAGPATAIRRERRILFDGVPAEIHPTTLRSRWTGPRSRSTASGRPRHLRGRPPPARRRPAPRRGRR